MSNFLNINGVWVACERLEEYKKRLENKEEIKVDPSGFEIVENKETAIDNEIPKVEEELTRIQKIEFLKLNNVKVPHTISKIDLDAKYKEVVASK